MNADQEIRIGHSVLVNWSRVYTSIASRSAELGNGPFRVVNVSRELRIAFVELAPDHGAELPLGALHLAP